MPKFGDYTASTAPNAGDLLLIKDVVSNSTKKITRSNLLVGTALPNDTVTTAAITNSAVTSDKIATDSHIIAYVEGLTSGQSTTSTSYVDATGITVTFTTPASCTKILLRAEGPTSNDTATVNTFAITNAANTIQVERTKSHSVGNVNLIDTFNMSRRITVTASTSYTFKLRFKVGGGTGVINQGNVSDRPTCLWVERA